MKKLLLIADVPKEAVDRLNQVFDVVWLPNNAKTADILKGARGAHAVICDPIIKFDPITIGVLAPTCRIIALCAGDCGRIDLKAASQKNITVCASTATVSDAKADMVFSLLFASGRKIMQGNEHVKFGRFSGMCPSDLLGDDVSLKTLGIIGRGALSRAVFLRADAFNMKVFYASRQADGALDKLGAKHVTLEELLAFSDYVTLHDEYRIENLHFDIMKQNSILINVVSSDLVSEEDLIDAIKQCKINGAALDVYSKECAVQLAPYDNCILTPKMGGATIKKRNAMIDDAIKNVLDYFDGQPLQGIVNEIN